ncbi:amino acid-binding protein [Clostridia bacterium]|nr:amino acid-binding protein [Clostridia bacterium]
MSIRQISVFLENSPGKLAAFTRILGDNSVDMQALTIADTTSFGILRCLAVDSDAALGVITKAGYAARLTEVIACVVPDRPGGLANVLTILADANISVEYCYSFAHGEKGAALALRVDDLAKAESVLTGAHITMLEQADLIGFKAE